MNRIQMKALAKVNLGLDVIRRREDGYHEVKMIMQKKYRMQSSSRLLQAIFFLQAFFLIKNSDFCILMQIHAFFRQAMRE